jgi:hypothetical protein
MERDIFVASFRKASSWALNSRKALLRSNYQYSSDLLWTFYS